MSYLVLARKWRPQGFGDLIGQEPVAKVLGNSILQGKIAHAYIFSGPRGVGKTSTARILAKALNCETGPTPEPCNRCEFCLSVTGGSSIDVMEIDGASNNSVDNIRDLREKVKYAPSGCRYKVYIIDEAHMLTESAFNALLKTLEEPPPHVIFVLATTEPRKIPLTVFSRCQHLPFRRISASDIKGRLERLVADEGINISPSALELIARAAEGSMRDALTMIDQVASVSTDVDEGLLKELLGLTDYGSLKGLAEALLTGRKEAIIESLSEFVDKGTDLRQLLRDMIKLMRDLLVLKLARRPQEALEVSEDELAGLKRLAATASEEHLLVLISELLKAEPELRLSSSPRIAFEMALLKASYLSALRPVKEAIRRLESSQEPKSKTPEPAKKPDSDKNASSPREVRRVPEQKPPFPEDVPVSPEDVSSSRDVNVTGTGDDAPLNAIMDTEITEAAAVKEDGEEGQAPSQEKKKPSGAGELLEMLAGRAKNPTVSSGLVTAEGAVNDGVLVLGFNGLNSELYEDALRSHMAWIESEGSALWGSTLKVRLSIKHGRPPLSRKQMTEKALADPVLKEALDLFDGKVIDIGETGGGKDKAS